MSPRIVDKEAKKNQIIHAALQVFAKNGIAKSKMIDIADAAGVGKGTIYEYFRSKEDIFAEAYQAMFAGMSEMLEKALSETDDPRKKLDSLINISLNFFGHDSRDFAAVMMDFWAEGVRTKNEKMIELIDLKQIYKEYRDLIGAIVQEGINRGIFKKTDVQSYAAIIIAALDGIFLQMIIDPQIIDIEKIKKSFSENIFSGILK